jgi:trans-aconitate 2-methyltransferase
MREWNAETYHRVSNPHVEWGTAVLERLPLAGDELVLDIGCGTGRLTERLLARVPRGHVVAIDLSSNMLTSAREHLRGCDGGHVSFAIADAMALPICDRADAVFSTASFHWVLDHERLFRSIRSALKPDGQLVAQCGGGRNLARIHARTDVLMRDPGLAPHFNSWQEPWEFADADTTARRLADAGFEDIRTSLEWAPVVHPDADAFRTFITNIICRPHLAYLPDAALRDVFINRLTEQAALDDPPFELDYWRLNIDARRSRGITRAD